MNASTVIRASAQRGGMPSVSVHKSRSFADDGRRQARSPTAKESYLSRSSPNYRVAIDRHPEATIHRVDWILPLYADVAALIPVPSAVNPRASNISESYVSSGQEMNAESQSGRICPRKLVSVHFGDELVTARDIGGSRYWRYQEQCDGHDAE
jgi:hypothetical protein